METIAASQFPRGNALINLESGPWFGTTAVL